MTSNVFCTCLDSVHVTFLCTYYVIGVFFIYAMTRPMEMRITGPDVLAYIAPVSFLQVSFCLSLCVCPPVPSLQALGPLATMLLSPVKSVMDLKRIHANIQKQGASFPLVESELEWAVCRMSQQSTEVMSEVMNIITALVYHRHPAVSVLCEPRPLEAIRGLLKVGWGIRACGTDRVSLAVWCVPTTVKQLFAISTGEPVCQCF